MVDLGALAHELTKPPKGILAADESTKSADARLKLYGIEPGEEARRAYRDLFLATEGIEQYLTGVILYEETLHQTDLQGRPFAKLLKERGIHPGIKVDTGTEPFPESTDELITNGLIGLPERLAGYVKDYGTTFTKWRAVIKIDGDRLPTASCIVENAKRLASYARMVQEAGMVPIIEPEVVLDGKHSRLRAREVITQTLKGVTEALHDHAVDLSAVIIKTAMAVSGSGTGKEDTPEEVATDTVDALMASVPSQVPGIVFLSGGQQTVPATNNLAAISARARSIGAPWNLTFSYARALQDEALTAWAGKEENLGTARALFLERLEKVGNAITGV